jgi:hypothetical protein
LKSILFRYYGPLALILLIVGATFLFQNRDAAAFLGGALGTLTDPIYLLVVLIIATLASFKSRSLIVGFGGVALAALLTSIYVAFIVHPSLGIHASSDQQLLIWASRVFGGIAILSLIWSVAGTLSLFKHTSSQSAGN